MPPTRTSPSSTKDDLIEALKDPQVAEALACALAPIIAREVSTALTAVQNKIAELESDNQRLRDQVMEQGGRLEELEIYSRSHDLVIRGLPESSYSEVATASVQDSASQSAESHSSVAKTVLRFCNDKLSVVVDASEISVAHRLKQGKNDNVRPIIVRFTNRRVRDEVLRAKKKLSVPRDHLGVTQERIHKDRVFICEHLTRSVSSLFYEARKLVKEKRLFAAWTHKGLVNVKRTGNPNEKPTVIRSLVELSQARN